MPKENVPHQRGRPVRRVARSLVWASLALGGLALASIRFYHALPAVKIAGSEEQAPARRAIACLGRIEPVDGVRVIGARSLSGQPSLVAELGVREGDQVRTGAVLAVLNSKDQLEAAHEEALASVELARRHLDQIRAGAKSGDIEAQNAEIARIQAQLANAQAEFSRTKSLYDGQVTSKSELDSRQMQVASTAELLKEAQERLRSLAEVRPTDLSAAEAEVAARESQARRAYAEYQAAFIRSPINGRVIKINARPGEEVGARGIMELADTSRMYVVAEVPDNSITQVKRGCRATITADGMAEALHGRVEQVGFRVIKNEVPYTDPAAVSDARVVEVKILLDEKKMAENLIHAQVRALIEP